MMDKKKMMDKQGEIENNIYSISYGDKSMWKIGGGKREWMVLEEVFFFNFKLLLFLLFHIHH